MIQVEALKGKTVVQAACGGSHTLFLTSDGQAFAAGRAEYVGVTISRAFFPPLAGSQYVYLRFQPRSAW